MTTTYPTETPGSDDDGTIVDNVTALSELVIGHRIVKAERGEVKKSEFETIEGGGYSWGDTIDGFVLTLDNGRRVVLEATSDCCAYTELKAFVHNIDKVDHVITGVGTTDGYEKWHIFADMGDVLELTVDWSAGNPFYYGYGFNIAVSDVIDADPEQFELEAGKS